MNEAKRLRATTSAIAKLKECFLNGEQKIKVQYCYRNIGILLIWLCTKNIFVNCTILTNQEVDKILANQEADTRLANQKAEPKSNSLTNGTSILVESGKIYLYTNC